LKRLGTTPLGRPRLLGAKVSTVLLVEVLQAVVLVVVGLALAGAREVCRGRRPSARRWRWGCFGTWAFGGIRPLLDRRAPAEVNLAAANGLYLVLLLLGGMIVPLAKLPSGLADVARLLPAAASPTASTARSARRGRSRSSLGRARSLGGRRTGPAALTFRWE